LKERGGNSFINDGYSAFNKKVRDEDRLVIFPDDMSLLEK